MTPDPLVQLEKDFDAKLEKLLDEAYAPLANADITSFTPDLSKVIKHCNDVVAHLEALKQEAT